MIETSSVLYKDGKFPIRHNLTGLAVSVGVARWLFVYCGWKQQAEFPDLQWVESTTEWAESENQFPSDKFELWVVGSRLHLN